MTINELEAEVHELQRQLVFERQRWLDCCLAHATERARRQELEQELAAARALLARRLKQEAP